MRALLVEDDVTTANGLAMMLGADGMIVDLAGTGEEAFDLVRHYDYDIVILDLMLPDMEGFDVVRRMRSARIGTPVLVLSGLSASQAKVKAFGAGADDYLTKPFDRAELTARVHAVVRRSRGFSQPTLRAGPLVLNLDSRQVTVGERPVQLTGKEFSILELMMLRKGAVLSKGAFLNHLYGGLDEPDVKIIDVFICKLRKKLQEAGSGRIIETVWGRGYMIREPARAPAPGSATAALAPPPKNRLALVAA
jgi:two-component system, cell cycle response regulator CtrA